MIFMIIIILNNGQLKKHRDICSEKQEVILTCLPTAFEMLRSVQVLIKKVFVKHLSSDLSMIMKYLLLSEAL